MLSRVAGFITGLHERETGARMSISLALNAPWQFTYHARDAQNRTIETNPSISPSSRCLLNKEICEELRDGNCLETKQGQPRKNLRKRTANITVGLWSVLCQRCGLSVRKKALTGTSCASWTPQALGHMIYCVYIIWSICIYTYGNYI